MSASRDQLARIARVRAALAAAGLDTARVVSGRGGAYHTITVDRDAGVLAHQPFEVVAVIPDSLRRRRRGEVAKGLSALFDELDAILERAELAELYGSAGRDSAIAKAVQEVGSVEAAGRIAAATPAQVLSWVRIGRVPDVTSARLLAEHTRLSVQQLLGIERLAAPVEASQ